MRKDVGVWIAVVAFVVFFLRWLDNETQQLQIAFQDVEPTVIENTTTNTCVKSNASSTNSSELLPQQLQLPTVVNAKHPVVLRNLRLVFLGDSVTRYQYLSLAYFLRHKRWFDPNITVNNLMNAHSFHHPLHPDEDWNEFFLQSNRALHPMEICDCLRSRDGRTVLERRYFYDAENRNLLVYINMNGNVTSPGRGYYGRLNGEDVFGQQFSKLAGLPFGLQLTGNQSYEKEIQWDFPTWDDLIRYHIGSLSLEYDSDEPFVVGHPIRRYVLMNAGLHPHDFRNRSKAAPLRDALTSIGVNGTWKTTTYTLQQLLEYQATLKFSQNGARVVSPHVRKTDEQMCAVLHRCFNLSWMALVKPELYFDDLHFLEPVYRVLNEEFLDSLGLLPDGFERLKRADLLIPAAQDFPEAMRATHSSP